MRFKRISVILSLFLLFLAVSTGLAVAANIDQLLQEEMDNAKNGEIFEVLIELKENPKLFNNLNNQQAVNLMKENAADSQQEFIEKLDKEKNAIKIKNQFWLVNVISAEVEKNMIKEIAKIEEVENIYSNFKLKMPEPKKEINSDQSWEHVETTRAPEFWEEGFRGQEITVAVLDTGLDPSHPEFNNELSYWAEFDELGNIISEDPSEAYDSDDHGSHTSGTVFGRNVGQYNIGMAPEATMAHGLVIPAGGGSFDQVAAGMEWAAEMGFDIVNMSLGADGQHEIMAEAADNLLAADVLLVASIGNSGEGVTGAPGNTPSAVGVGAYGSNGEITYFSGGGIVEYPGYEYDENTRIKPDISAPGDTIYSVKPGGGYQNMSGTSMSSPHLAGAAALIKSANPELSAVELRELVYSSVGGHEDLGWSDESEEKDVRYGWGRINLLKALEEIDFVEGPAADIEGTITCKESNKRLEGISLEFAGPVTKVVETDEDGEYSLELPEGFYDITVTGMGFEEIIDQEIEIAGTEDYTINYQLTPAPEGEIMGTVVDSETGQIVDGAEVEIIDPINEEIEVDQGEFSVSLMEEYYTLSIDA
ncbi:MAG: S8 family serine peptidase, partial [Bacillota bacterium]